MKPRNRIDWKRLVLGAVAGAVAGAALAFMDDEAELDARRRAVVIAALVPVALLPVVALVAWAVAS